MNNKRRKTLKALFEKPTLATLLFSDIERLLLALGCTLTEGKGSRVRFDPGPQEWHADRPHPGNEAKHYQV